MDPEDIALFADAARVCGAKDASSFAREMFRVMLSPDAEARVNYALMLTGKLGEQLTLPLAPIPEPKKATKRKARGKGAKPRGRS
jgi:hypothetical protein